MERQRPFARQEDPVPCSPGPARSGGPIFPPLTELVPHRPPMLLLDEVVAWEAEGEGERVECRVALRPDSPFVEGGTVPATIAIEYMAQCIAVHAGLRGHARREPVRIGYLLGAREVTLEADEFRVGDELRVEAFHLWGDDAMGSFSCAVRRAGVVVARGTLNVYRGDLNEIRRR